MSGMQRADRVRSLLRAQIVFNQGSSCIDCVVRNISATGVRIDIPESIALPSEFDLRIPHRNRTFRVKLVRRSGSAVGGQFVDKAGVELPANASRGEMEAEDGRSPSSIEEENARLRARIRLLSRRLEELGQDLTLIETGY